MSIDNPWWLTGTIPDDYKKMPRRSYNALFYPMVSDRSVRRATILMGPRRVGKTVMIYHIIDKLLQSGVNPQKIIYLSIDTPIYNNISLEDLFNFARQALRQEDVYQDFYVFYDEIQYLSNWEIHLKTLVDSYRSVKFVASGSAAAALKMKSNESGAGRFTDFMLPPLTFYEYVQLLGYHNLIVERNVSSIIPYDSINMDELNRIFLEYLNYGGYPEVVFSEKIRSNPGLYIKNDIIDKVLLRDLPSLYGITDIQELNKLFVHIAFRSGNEFSYEKLSSESGVKKETLKKYLAYLEAAYLIKVVHRIDQNAKHLQRVTQFKIYLTNPTLRCALFSPIVETDDYMGSMVETAVFAQWIQGEQKDFYYANWTSGREKGEVDLVWTDPATQQAVSLVEVKWTDRYYERPKELKSLYSFLELNRNLHQIIVTTKSKTGSYMTPFGNIQFIPTAIYTYWIADSLLANKTQKLLG
jgi:predicted AAA+ superfamily ATPase